ncbi:MAG: hypothetical protein KAQ85_00815 [Thermodesulfovibrionia bacterium]|nr:hypothetical protein [Thermodesulfovibrionia bacterium]
MISKEWDLAIQLVAISVLAYQALRYKFLLITAIESNRGRESLCENYKSLIDSMLMRDKEKDKLIIELKKKIDALERLRDVHGKD